VIFAQQSAAYEAVYQPFLTGLVGTVSVMVVDNDGNVVTAPATTAITEQGTTGVYTAERVAPADTGQYTIIWSIDGSYDADTNTIEDLLVAADIGAAPLPPLPPPGQAGGLSTGPCSSWTTDVDVAACCTVEVGSDTSVFDDSIAAASELLWELSGRLHSGSCQQTVRPCMTGRGCRVQVLSRGHVVSWCGDGWCDDSGTVCGCTALDRVLLPGYPVREIVEVTVDGVAVDPATYRLDGYRWLVRMNDPVTGDALSWPSCQNLARESTEDGTFAVTYLYGVDPPMSGRLAATELACETYKACAGEECALPTGTTRVVRQGIVIEKLAFTAWGLQGGIWRTGLPQVDAFLNSVNPNRLRRRPVIWSPASQLQYARRAG